MPRNLIYENKLENNLIKYRKEAEIIASQNGWNVDFIDAPFPNEWEQFITRSHDEILVGWHGNQISTAIIYTNAFLNYRRVKKALNEYHCFVFPKHQSACQNRANWDISIPERVFVKLKTKLQENKARKYSTSDKYIEMPAQWQGTKYGWRLSTNKITGKRYTDKEAVEYLEDLIRIMRVINAERASKNQEPNPMTHVQTVLTHIKTVIRQGGLVIGDIPKSLGGLAEEYDVKEVHGADIFNTIHNIRYGDYPNNVNPQIPQSQNLIPTIIETTNEKERQPQLEKDKRNKALLLIGSLFLFG